MGFVSETRWSDSNSQSEVVLIAYGKDFDSFECSYVFRMLLDLRCLLSLNKWSQDFLQGTAETRYVNTMGSVGESFTGSFPHVYVLISLLLIIRVDLLNKRKLPQKRPILLLCLDRRVRLNAIWSE
ncbi:hypothetical protein TRVL_10093 [Trypanosoma vivax]|nr:hypothetical protein TRVL_10093 [Trypanosoma vivax]